MRYDAIVIGSGQAGNPLVHRLVDHGWTVALVEKEHLGGTCVNTGCTPTKTLVMCAQVAHYARNAATWGVSPGDGRVDLAAIVAIKDRVVESFRGGHERSVEAQKDKLHLHRGRARFAGPRRVEVDGRVLESERIFINTGARTDVPAIEGLEAAGYHTHATILDLTELPEHLLVLGGGYIGLELGQVFRRFGSRVTVVHRRERVLPREDPDVSEALREALEAEGMRFVLGASATRARREGGRVTLSVETAEGRGERLEGSHVLVATGRRPNTDDLGLDAAGVATDARGFVRVNSRLETSVPGIWALGDVKGGPAFTHISYHDFQVVHGNLIEGKNVSIDGRPVPYAVFTDPQLGRVGMTEAEARSTGRKLKIGKIPMSRVARARERGETAGLMKLVVDAGTDRVLGAAILATEGGELVHVLHALMMADAPYTLLRGAIYIHPALAEGFWALMESVEPVD